MFTKWREFARTSSYSSRLSRMIPEQLGSEHSDERDGRLDAVGARRCADALVRLSKGRVVRCDPFLRHSLHVFSPFRDARVMGLAHVESGETW